MAWIEVKKLKDEIEDVAGGRSTALRVYMVRSDVPVTGDQALSAAAGGKSVDARNAAYSSSRPYLRCKRRRPISQSSRVWVVDCQFEEPENGSVGNDTDLLSLPAVVTRDADVVTKPYDRDAEDTYVRNVAGDRFDRLPERQVGTGVFRIRKYVNAATKATIEAIWNTNNDAPVVIDGVTIPADRGWFGEWPSFDPVEGSTGIYLATYAIYYRKDGWIDKTPNYGFSARPAAGEPACRIEEELMDKDGNPTGKYRALTVPWPLAEDATAMPNRDDDPFESEFYPYELADWSGLPVS